MKEIKTFVPGRVGFIGELSDLVSPYLDKNKKLIPGKCLACRINKGIYAVSRKSQRIIYQFKKLKFECDLNESSLLQEINNNSFYSYLCGTILYLFRKYSVGGIDITISKMDLPIKVGLSSSAAFSLTIVKAYNELYNLKLTDDEIINCAHEGEILAGSRCGNLDYVSIMNDGLLLLTFYKDQTMIERIPLRKSLHFLVVDLNSSKNTKKIMHIFNRELSSDFTSDDILDIVGQTNEEIVYHAVDAIKNSDITEFINCLNKAQNLMDKASGICDEFIAPKLHIIMKDNYIKKLSCGIKSIGSGGDGSALIIANNINDLSKIKKYLKKIYGMKSIDFTIKRDI